MNSKLLGPLKIFLWFVCAFHVIVGVGLNVSADFPQVMAGYYGATVNWTPELLYLVKPIGAFMLVVGAMAGAAARNPLSHRSIVYGLVLLFAVRGIQRIVFQEEIGNAVAIAATRNFANAVFFLLMAVALAALFNLAGKKAESTA